MTATARLLGLYKKPPWSVLLAAAIIVAVVGGIFWLTKAEDPGSARLPDFTAYTAGHERKQAFFDYLGPIISARNDRILRQRIRLEAMAVELSEGKQLQRSQRNWFTGLARRYQLELTNDIVGIADVDGLLGQVDIIPMPLALVQAAKESAWGTSRFARKANNLFGQWCYTPGCGIVPGNRPAGSRHEVQMFKNVGAAVKSYFFNINTHASYRPLREIRARQRNSKLPVTGTALADGLLFYSERREDYVVEVKDMIRLNQPYFVEHKKTPRSAVRCGRYKGFTHTGATLPHLKRLCQPGRFFPAAKSTAPAGGTIGTCGSCVTSRSCTGSSPAHWCRLFSTFCFELFCIRPGPRPGGLGKPRDHPDTGTPAVASRTLKIQLHRTFDRNTDPLLLV